MRPMRPMRLRRTNAVVADARPLSVLVLCTGNSCRSIIAEVLINSLGSGRFRAFSAGSHPGGTVNPNALQKLGDEGHDTGGVASKSWDRFEGDGAIPIDIVITVCDNAAGESCPVWNGSPVTVHWGIPDPADAVGADIAPAFERTYRQLRARVEDMLELPLEEFDTRQRREALQRLHESAVQSEHAG